MSGLKVTPASVELKDIQAGALQAVLVTVKNAEKRKKTLRLRAPKSKYFSIRGWQQSQELAAGLETVFEVLFEAQSLEGVKEIVQDKVVIQTDTGDYELSLKALLPRSDVVISGDLNFGLVPIDSKATKRFQLINRGAAPASFKIDNTQVGSITFEPSSGEVPGSGSDGSGVSVITAVLSVESTGAVSGDIGVIVDGGVDAKKLTFCATGVKHHFELLEPSGAVVNEVDFGCHYFGELLERTVHLFNNGPVEGRFMIMYGTPTEIKKKLEESEGNGAADDADDPYAGFMMAARHKVRSQQTRDNPFTISPPSGVMAPYSRTSITIRYKPEDAGTQRGFSTLLPASDQTGRTYDFMALVEMFGLPQKIKLPVKGRAMAGGLRLTPSILEFGDVATNSYVDQLVMAVNTNSAMPLKFKVDKASPYFEVQPAAGTILGGQAQQLLVRYQPKAMGQHSARLPFCVYSEAGKTIQEDVLCVSGSSLRQGRKAALVGGTDKLPADFEKQKKYLDGDQVFTSKMETLKKSSKRDVPLWNQPHLKDALDDIGPVGNQFTMSKEELMAMKKHKDTYKDFISAKRTAQKAAHLMRRVDEKDVNLGMDTRSGLVPFEPRLPKAVDPLWTVGAADAGKPRQQRLVPAAELEGMPYHKDRPETEQERVDCLVELSKEELSRLIVGPKTIDFGTVSASSVTTQHLLVVNTLHRHIHVVLDAQSPAELKKSPHTSQVIPPGARAKFPLLLTACDVRHIDDHIEYSINSSHVMSAHVTADVVPVSLDLSSEEFQFEFSVDNWDSFLDKVLIMDNHNKFPVDFSLSSTNPVFTVNPASGTVKPSSSAEVSIRWAPPLDGSATGNQQGHVVVALVGGDQNRKIFLNGLLPEGHIRFRDKLLDAGLVPCGIPQTVRTQVRNAGTRDSAFMVLPHPLLTITPPKDKLAADDTMDLEISFNCLQPGPFSTVVELAVQGSKSIKLPFKAEGVVPCVELQEDEFVFGPVFIGNSVKLPLTLVNTTPVPAMATLDLRAHPELAVVLSKDAWSTTEYETCPLQRLDAGGHAAGGRSPSSNGGSISGSRRNSRRGSSASGFGGGTDGALFHIQLNPSATLPLQLVFRPNKVAVQDVELAISTMSNGVAPAAAAPGIRKVASMAGVQPRIMISKTSIDFESRTVIRSNQIKAPYTFDIYVRNSEIEETGVPLTVTFGKPVGVVGGSKAVAGIFVVKPGSLVVSPGMMVAATISFCPRDAKKYECTIPVYLDDDLSSAYLTLEVQGTGQYPRLSFNTRECVLPPVPLGIPSKGTFTIVNNGYDNLELRYRLPADEGHQPMKVEFPEGNLIGIAKEQLPVVVTFASDKPLSFTANIDFMDEDGKRYSLPVTATADNCLLTHQAFLQANSDILCVEHEEGTPVSLGQREGVAYNLPPASAVLGPTLTSANICRFLNATTSRAGPLDQMLQLLQTSRGKLAVELVELLSGKAVPNKASKHSNNKKEAAEATLALFDSLLVFLKSHGALLNAVKPEMLLEYDDFDRILNARSNLAATPEELDAVELWSDIDQDFATVSAQAWNSLVLQMFKVFVLGRVTLKAFKTLPGIDQAGVPLPPDSTIVGSNLYSVPESVLLAWMTMHFGREFGDKAHRVTNFDEDLASGLVLFSLLSGHWPSLSARKVLLRTTSRAPRDYLDNNELVVRIMADLGLPFEVSPEELSSPDPREMLVLCLYLYQTLPQFVPRTSIQFNCKLGDTVTKDLELTNPSKKAISYTVRLEGHKDFTSEASIIRIEAKGTARLHIKCSPTTTIPVSCRLILMSRRDGGANAATLVFLLESRVNTRAPVKRVNVDGPLYELQQFEFVVNNPFPADGEFSITLLHEPAEPPARKEPDDKKGKNRGGRAPGAAGRKASDSSQLPEPPKPQVYPSAFGVDKPRLRIKNGGSDKLRAFYLPFTMETHYCTLVFKDREQGEFVYELVGSTALPAPLLENKGTVPLEGPHQYELPVPWSNHLLETAKRVFMDKHPLAKDKTQAQLLKGDALKVTEIEYSVTQTNSLITCPRKISLVASAASAAAAEGQAAGAGARHVESGKGRGLVLPGKAAEEAAAAAAAAAGGAAAANMLRMTLKPMGTGIYPTRLLLSSVLDTRVLDLELTAQVMVQQFQLEFSGAVRQAITQEVPLVNTSDLSMTVKAQLDGVGWSGSKEVTVPAKSTVNYVLQFRPIHPGDYKGQLELCIPSTGERNVYSLGGKAADPLSEGHIVIECQARQSLTRAMGVPNIVGAPVEYQVFCDMDVVSGPEFIKCPSSQAVSYKLTAAPQKSGTYLGTITFKTSDGQTLWYVLEVRASEPAEIATIDVQAQVRKAVSIKVPMVNPLSVPTTMRVQYSNPDVLLGPATLDLPVSKDPTQLEFFFAPLVAGQSSGSVMLVNEELGEFWFQLRLSADPVPPEVLPELAAELGGRPCTCPLKVDNALGRAITMTATSSDPRRFKVTPSTVILPAYGSADLTLEYMPCSLSLLEEGSVRVESEEGGVFEFLVSGRGLEPAPAETTTLVAVLGTAGQGMVSWRNPFSEPVEAVLSYSGSSPEVELLLDETTRTQNVNPFAMVQVPLSFSPSSLKQVTGEVTVTVARPPGLPASAGPLVWRLPIRGTAEAKQVLGTALKFKCKARSKLEETVEIVLNGLAAVGQDEEFTHELIIPAEAKQHLDPGALEITALDTRISHPEQPLVFQVTFKPQSMFSADVEFVVHKATGGRWRFDVHLQATEPDLDGLISIEAAMDTTASCPIYLYSRGSEPQNFTANFTSDTPLQFSVTPNRGVLRPRPADAPTELFGTTSVSGMSMDPASAPIWVSYTCRDFGKVVKGRLFIQTPDGQYSFDVRGRMPTYVPPKPTSFDASVDHKLSPEMAERLKRAASTKRSNIVAANLKGVKELGGSRRL